jgi:ribosomal protein S3AE
MAKAKKRKKFFEVKMPLIGKSTQLYGYEPEDLDGKIIKYDLTRLLKGKNMILHLNVKSGEEVTTTPRKVELVHSFINRIVRRGTSYVEDSFKTKSKDAELIVKPFLVARRKIHRSVRKALREKAKEEITKELESKTTEEIFEEVIKGRFQKALSQKLKKVYPLSACEIRVLEVVPPKEE